MNYVDQAAVVLAQEMPRQVSPELLRLYTLLALTKGSATTLADVHNAWALAETVKRPDHRSLIPFEELTPEVQELDRPYVNAIRIAAARLMHRDHARRNPPSRTPGVDEREALQARLDRLKGEQA